MCCEDFSAPWLVMLLLAFGSCDSAGSFLCMLLNCVSIYARLAGIYLGSDEAFHEINIPARTPRMTGDCV